MRKPPTLCLFVTAACLAPAALAQPGGAATPTEQQTPEPAAPLYRVEIIVFAYDEADPAEERFRSPRGPEDAGDAPGVEAFDFDALASTRLGRPGTRPSSETSLPGAAPAPGQTPAPGATLPPGQAPASGDAPLNAAAPPGAETPPAGGATPRPQSPADAEGLTVHGTTPFRFRILDPGELQLEDTSRRLENLDAYTPLLHGGWIQEGLPEDRALPFDLSYLGAMNLSGTIQLYVSRFLHLEIDVDYRPGAPYAAGASPPAARSPAPAPGSTAPRPRSSSPGFEPFGLSEVALAPSYALTTQRRISSRDLNYFDHPYFGMIVVVTPHEPVPAAQAGDTGPAA